jgi:mRNA interferase MazF
VKRGDIIIVAPPSPFNKPRPALIVQAFLFDQSEKLTVALISSDLTHSHGFRIPIAPTASNGLRKPSEILVDHLQTVDIGRVGGFAGQVDEATMREVDTALRIFLGL